MLAALGIALVVALAGIATRSGSYTSTLPPGPTVATTPPTGSGFALPTRSAASVTRAADQQLPVNPVTGWVVLGLVLVLAAVGLALLVRFALRSRLAWPGRRPAAAPVTSVEGTGEQIPAAVAQALRAVEQPDAREAVVQAWLVLGAAAAAAGTAARPAETASEYAERIAAAHRLPAASVHRLAELYREARFSAHEVRAEHRDEARARLQELQTALRHEPSAPGPR